MSQNDFFFLLEIERDGITSFMDFMSMVPSNGLMGRQTRDESKINTKIIKCTYVFRISTYERLLGNKCVLKKITKISKRCSLGC